MFSDFQHEGLEPQHLVEVVWVFDSLVDEVHLPRDLVGLSRVSGVSGGILRRVGLPWSPCRYQKKSWSGILHKLQNCGGNWRTLWSWWPLVGVVIVGPRNNAGIVKLLDLECQKEMGGQSGNHTKVLQCKIYSLISRPHTCRVRNH